MEMHGRIERLRANQPAAAEAVKAAFMIADVMQPERRIAKLETEWRARLQEIEAAQGRAITLRPGKSRTGHQLSLRRGNPAHSFGTECDNGK